MASAESEAKGMPAYFFDVYDGLLDFIDENGQSLDSREDARQTALAMLPQLVISDQLISDQPVSDCRKIRVDVRDAHGQVILTARLSLSSEWRT